MEVKTHDGRFSASISEVRDDEGEKLYHLEILEGDELVFDFNSYSIEGCIDWLNRLGRKL